METENSTIQALEQKTFGQKPGVYSPVTVDMPEAIGAIFLGITVLILLVALLRAEGRNRALMMH